MAADDSSRIRRVGNGFKDMTGLVFGKLTVIRRKDGVQAKVAFWVCRCECGREAIVQGGKLRRGHTRSCGCLVSEHTTAMKTTHGGSKTREYKIWKGMIYRCENPKAKRWERYGGRGISVCERWRNSFPNFLADMGPRPSPEHSIERKDSNGNYEPDNCIWATATEQSKNTSRNLMFTHEGKTLCLSDWARHFKIRIDTLWYRLKAGKSFAESVSLGLPSRIRK